MKLYGYWRSSSAYRVRIALALKGLEVEHVPVHLVRDGGEQHRADYRALNPQARVPTLVDGEVVITQSNAICEYLEETHPDPALLPTDAAGRARVRSLVQIVGSDVQPLQNLAVLAYLTGELGHDEDTKLAWIRRWVGEGLAAFEQRLDDGASGAYCHGDAPGLADCFLVPQVYNAERFGCDLSAAPLLTAIVARCREHPAFRAAAPEAQPDAVHQDG